MIPLLLWKPHSRIIFKEVIVFGTFGYDFMYYQRSSASRKLIHCSWFGRFVGMESNHRLALLFITGTNRIQKVRFEDSHPVKNAQPPSVPSLLDGLFHQRSIDEDKQVKSEDIEEKLLDFLATIQKRAGNEYISLLALYNSYTGICDGPALPRHFNEACKEKMGQ